LHRTSTRWVHSTLAGSQLLELHHVWHGLFWTTLRFVPELRHQPRGAVTLTVWKHHLSSTAWSALRICVARQVAMPVRRTAKEDA
jgi:hypothetical protein